jgi:hypothetical protein
MRPAYRTQPQIIAWFSASVVQVSRVSNMAWRLRLGVDFKYQQYLVELATGGTNGPACEATLYARIQAGRCSASRERRQEPRRRCRAKSASRNRHCRTHKASTAGKLGTVVGKPITRKQMELTRLDALLNEPKQGNCWANAPKLKLTSAGFRESHGREVLCGSPLSSGEPVFLECHGADVVERRV